RTPRRNSIAWNASPACRGLRADLDRIDRGHCHHLIARQAEGYHARRRRVAATSLQPPPCSFRRHPPGPILRFDGRSPVPEWRGPCHPGRIVFEAWSGTRRFPLARFLHLLDGRRPLVEAPSPEATGGT